VRQTLRKSEILSGYQSFEQVLQNGVCVRGNLLHCFVLVENSFETAPTSRKPPLSRNKKSSLCVGFAVPKKRMPLATKRNRIKRLMREVFRKNKEQLYNALDANRRISVVIMYRGEEKTVSKISYDEVEREWKELVPQIIAVEQCS
jgi:ribonuclease P protein component